MKFRNLIVSFKITLIFLNAQGQSKLEMQNYITQDLKKYAGTWLQTHNGSIAQKENNYKFVINNCNLIITSRYTDDGTIWGDAKVIIPITDISEFNLIPSTTRGSAGNIWTVSTRLQIRTGGHTMKRYWNGKFIDMDDNHIIGLDRYTSDIAEKYKSVFREYIKYCE